MADAANLEAGKPQVVSARPKTNVDAAERRLWALYSEEAGKYDNGLALNWKGDMDSILIFAGLFTASVTAMIVESYKLLKPDSGDQTVALLTQISQQLAHISNVTNPALPIINSESFRPTTSIVICNFLFFLSLGFTLLCAIGATLVEQWVRQYLQETQSGTAADNARVRQYLYQGIVRFRMLEVVEAIPFLLHISLFLFFAGLCVYLYPINRIIGALCIFIFLVCLILYLIPSLTPIIERSCPYRTPLTTIFWRLLQSLPDSLGRYEAFKSIPQRSEGNLTEARVVMVTSDSEALRQRDHDAIGWLVKSRMDDTGIQALCEVLPLLSTGDFLGHHDLLFNLLDQPVMLGHRIVSVLGDPSHKHLQSSQVLQRNMSCFEAVWTILHTTLMKRSRGCFLPLRDGSYVWFDLGNTLRGTLHMRSDSKYLIVSTKAYIWSQVMWELRVQLQEVSSETGFIEFVTRTRGLLTLDRQSLVNMFQSERVFCSFLAKLNSMLERLRSLSHTDASYNLVEKRQRLSDDIDSLSRSVLVDYMIHVLQDEFAAPYEFFFVTAATVLSVVEPTRDISLDVGSAWFAEMKESVKAVNNIRLFQTGTMTSLLQRVEKMVTLPGLDVAYASPFRLILDALHQVLCDEFNGSRHI
ncbi:hypothetical protein C8J56DRAFT_922079 [Mycena floridula]|nr:hypothetical protein C8J56DRAFT_922079 [Mycena floridula]